jgi:membrane protein YqaA with SNARE-associated domain
MIGRKSKEGDSHNPFHSTNALTTCFPFAIFQRMESFLASHGYLGLFVLSILASTLLPIGSEWLLVLMLLNGSEPIFIVAIASVGNYLGGCTTWAVGVWGGPFLVRRVLRIDRAAEATAERFYRRYGAWSLLLSWLPIIGDPLCLAGGILKVGFARFSLLVFTGKLIRYAGVAWLTLGTMRIV